MRAQLQRDAEERKKVEEAERIKFQSEIRKKLENEEKEKMKLLDDKLDKARRQEKAMAQAEIQLKAALEEQKKELGKKNVSEPTKKPASSVTPASDVPKPGSDPLKSPQKTNLNSSTPPNSPFSENVMCRDWFL